MSKKIAPNATIYSPPEGTPKIYLEMTKKGKVVLSQLTKNNIGKRLAIIANGKIIAAPRIMAPINGGRMVIAGPFTIKEAKDLVGKLNK